MPTFRYTYAKYNIKNPDNAVGIATGHGLDNPGGRG
jgi:hypothetical protein